MKVTVSNMTEKPLNISRLAPLMPVQVLGVNQEIKVNVKDIDAVIEKAAEIGVTVTPMDEALKITELTEPDSHIDDTTDPDGAADKEPVVDDDSTETNEDNPESVLTDEDNKDTTAKSKRSRKSSKSKASVLKSIIGNNK